VYVVAVPHQDGWRGRLVAAPDTPTVIDDLETIVARDGLATARQKLTVDHDAWTSITPDQPAGEGAVAGYGTLVTADHDDEWVTSTGPSDLGATAAYVLDDDGITAYDRITGPAARTQGHWALWAPRTT